MNRIVELERKSSEILSDIQDVMHAASINMRGVCVEVSQEPISTLQQQFLYTEGLLQNLKQLINSRQALFMTFLITKQIQQEESKVRRERLNQYEQKIYDQKRIIVQKEIFFESLLRPKRKRLPHQSTEEFQQSRARQRQNEQKFKAGQLITEMMDFQVLRRMIDEQQRLKRKAQLQSTKNSSLSNLTASNLDAAQFATERVLPNEQKGGKDSRSNHNRTNSAQHYINKDYFSSKKDDPSSDLQTAKVLLESNTKMSEKIDELHLIYDQQLNSYNFKKNQKLKTQKQYQAINQQLKNSKKYYEKLKKKQFWRYQRVNQPPSPNRKRSDSK